MKCMLTFLFLVVTATSFGQYQSGFLPEFFFGRQPSARTEAMGKAYTAIDGDMGSVYFNPAGVATAKQIEISTSYTPPGYYSTKGYYTSYGVSYKAFNHLQISLSRFQFNFGKTTVSNATKTPYEETTTLTLSSEPIKNVLIGLNANYFIWQPGIAEASKALLFDFGVIKKFELLTTVSHNRQTFSLGAYISNANYATTTATFNNIPEKYHLPVLGRFGACYQSATGRSYLFDSTNLFNFLVQSEYQLLLNSTYRSAIKFGGEVTWKNFISIRAGWYREKVYDFGLPDDNNNNISGMTYGAGLHLPFYALFKLPVAMQFDFTSLPQVSYSKTNTSWNNFKTYSLRMMYMLPVHH